MTGVAWQPTSLPAHLHTDPDPEQLGKLLLAIIEDAIVNHPRSLQEKIGPSEIGNPCARALGYKLLNAPTFNYRVNWKAQIGTAVHAWLQGIFDAWCVQQSINDPAWAGEERFYTEQKVTTGQINGDDIDGSTDVYDRATGTVIDWKNVGPSKILGYRRNGPGPQYRVQAHAYGRGWRARALPVTQVMIVFLPRNGDLHNAVIWHEPYDEQVAIDGFARINGIAAATTALGVQALAVLPTVDHYCTHCDYYKPGSADLTAGCPGDPASQVPARPALTMSRPNPGGTTA